MKSCIQPFAKKWANHRELGKVRLYHDIYQYLGETMNEGDILNDTHLYKCKDDIAKGNEDNAVNYNISLSDLSDSINETITDPTIPSNVSIRIEPRMPLDSIRTATLEKSVSAENGETVQIEQEELSQDNIEQEEEEIVTLDKYHTIVHKSKLKLLEKKAKKYDSIMRQLTAGTYHGTPLGDAMIGFASSLVPQCGHAGVSTITPILLGSVLANAGIEIENEKLVNSQPSGNSIQRFVEQNALNTLLLTQESIKDNTNVYVSADKGNKKGNKNLAKFVCWFDKKENQVKIFLLDVDCTDEATKNIADALEHSMRRISPNCTISILGQCTDSGGGGTKFALARALTEKNMTSANYLVCTCSLHNLQTCLRNAVTNVLGEGGMNEKGEPVKNVMQMLHGAYNIQNWQENEELKELWTYLSATSTGKFKRLEEPIMTRWWLVGACACSFKESIDVWQKICQAIRNSAPSGCASSKIASCTLNLIDSPVIINDLDLMCSFHQSFLFPHFKFLQLADDRASKMPSFQARHLTVRYFLMWYDLKKIEKEWRTDEHFDDYRTSLEVLDETDKVLQKKKFTHFYRYVFESLTMHFKQWTSHLLFLALFSNQRTATPIANMMIGQIDPSRGQTHDEDHNRVIEMREYKDFLNKNCTREIIMQQRSLPVVIENNRAIRMIADGHNMWAPNACDTLKEFRLLYLHRYAALPTNTQFTERGVKESGYVSLGRRGETNRSVLAISRAKMIPDALKKGRKEIELENLKQLQGKTKTKVLLRELLQQQKSIDDLAIKRNRDGEDFKTERKKMKLALTDTTKQFKMERIKGKVEHVKSKAHNTPAPNVYQRRTGQTLTPLMQGKIQYHKLKKDHNLAQIKNELTERRLHFDPNTNWTALLSILKQDEGNKKYFHPRTNYDMFKWNSTHFHDED